MAVKQSPASVEHSLTLYSRLYLIRRAEQKIIKLYPENEMKTPMHMSMGQEAVSVGVCAALGEKGQIFSSYRSHAAFLARTGDAEMFFMEMYGRSGTLAGGKAGSMHLSDPSRGHICSSAVVGSVIPLAAGAAFANKRAANGHMACVFFGDGALEEGIFWETLNSSCVLRLPVLLVCEDNGLAQHASTESRQGFRSIAEVVRTFECHVFEDDTTDVEKIHRLATEAVRASFADNKPAFMHLKCYRYLEHVGTGEDFDAGYRTRAEYEVWFKKDPVALQRKRLLDSGLTEHQIAQEERAIDDRIGKCVEKAKAASFPEKQALMRGVFYEKN